MKMIIEMTQKEAVENQFQYAKREVIKKFCKQIAKDMDNAPVIDHVEVKIT